VVHQGMGGTHGNPLSSWLSPPESNQEGGFSASGLIESALQQDENETNRKFESTLESNKAGFRASSTGSNYNMLLDLPYPIDQCILCEWVEIQDLASLDVAFTNHTLRDSFLQLLTQRSFRSLTIEQINLPKLYTLYLQWLMKRNIYHKLLALDRKNWKFLLLNQKKFATFLNKVEILGIGCTQVENTRQFPLRTLSFCPNLTALILINISECSHLKYAYCEEESKGNDIHHRILTNSGKKKSKKNISKRLFLADTVEENNENPVVLSVENKETRSRSPDFNTSFDEEEPGRNTPTPLRRSKRKKRKALLQQQEQEEMEKEEGENILDTSFQEENDDPMNVDIIGVASPVVLAENKPKRINLEKSFFHFQKMKAISILNSNLNQTNFNLLFYHSPALQGMMINNSIFTFHLPSFSGEEVNDNENELSKSIFTKLKFLQVIKCYEMSNQNLIYLLQSCAHLEYFKIQKENSSLFNLPFNYYQQNHHLTNPFPTVGQTDGDNTVVPLQTTTISEGKMMDILFHYAHVMLTHIDDLDYQKEFSAAYERNLFVSPQSQSNSSSSSPGIQVENSACSSSCLPVPINHFFTSLSLLNCPLKTLDLEGINELKDSELILLISGVCCTVQEINLNFCHDVTNNSLIFIGQRCPLLRILMLSFCYNINEYGLKQFSFYFQQTLAAHASSTNSSSSMGNVYSSPPRSSKRLLSKGGGRGLEVLHLYGCYLITDDGLIALLPVIKDSLYHISISECPLISDQSLIALVSNCSHLEKLCMNRSEPCSRITDQFLDHFMVAGVPLSTSFARGYASRDRTTTTNVFPFSATSSSSMTNYSSSYSCSSSSIPPSTPLLLSQLKTLLMSHYVAFSTNKLSLFFTFSTSLVILDLSKNATITDEVVKVIASHCLQLKNVDLHLCVQLTNQSMDYLARHSSQLQELNIKLNFLIDDQGILMVLKNCFNIMKIDANYCNLNDDKIQQMKREMHIWNQGFIFYRRMKPNAFQNHYQHQQDNDNNNNDQGEEDDN
jgi:hypothetical protein